jgi:PAS domain S-box-containing protein
MKKDTDSNRQSWTVLTVVKTYYGLIVALMGMPVLLHWQSHFPAWIPMQPNAAIGFVLLGLSVILLELEKKKSVQFIAFFIILLGFSTLVQYVFHIDLGIDEFIKKGISSVYENSRGRMAPNSALSFVIMAGVLWVISKKNLSSRAIYLSGLTTLFPLASCFVSVLSYCLDLRNTYGWGSYSVMAFPTATAFVMLGFILMFKFFRLLSLQANRNTYLKPLYLTLILFVMILSFWQYFLLFNAKSLTDLTEEKIQSSIQKIELRLSENKQALKRMAQRIENTGISERRLLTLDAESYLNDLVGMKSLGIVDNKRKILWSVPKHFERKFLHENPELVGLFQNPELISSFSFKSLSRLDLHRAKLIFFLPLKSSKNRTASLFSIIDSRVLIEDLLNYEDFETVVRIDGHEVYHQTPKRILSELSWRRIQGAHFEGVHFQVELTPTRERLGRIDSYFPGFILFVGLLFSALLGISLQVVFHSRDKKIQMIESEKRFRLLIESLKEYAIFMLDLRGDIMTWNNGAMNIYGYRTSEILGKSFSVFYTKDDIEAGKPAKELLRARADGKFEEDGLRIRKDGTSFWANSTITRITDASGELIGYGKVIRDLTEQKSLQESRLASAAWQKAIVEGAGYSIISTNAEGLIQTFNSTAEKMLGYRAEDMIGKESPAILHDLNEVISKATELSQELGYEVSPGFDVFVVKSKLSNIPDENEWTYIRKDGSRFSVLLSVTALRDGDNQITGYLGIASDLTEKKKTLQELQATTKKLSALINASPISILSLNQDLKLTTWNPACEKVFGWTAKEALGDYMPFVTQDKMGESLKAVDKIRESKVPTYFQSERVRKDGVLINIETAAMPILNDQDEIEGIIAIMQDVTEKVRLENEILSTNRELKIAVEHAQRTQQKAIKATKVKSDFLANMSHEIRTPINGIIGMTNLLLDSNPETEQREFAESIKYSADALLTIINDILDFSKVEAGKLELEEIAFDIHEMLTETVKSLSHLAKLKKIKLQVDIEKQWTTSFYGDPGRIRQVLNNLVSNAIKFSSEGEVTIRLIEMHSNELETRFRVEVQDHGIGISKTVQERLFQPFEQADTSTARRFGGTGLGLSISKKLVEMMKGEIGVVSRESEGSTFWFEITMKNGSIISASSQTAERAKHILGSELLDKRILVAEDNPINQKVVLKQLEKMGLRADAVANGNEVLSALESAPYDLILMDCQMPEKDGYETSRFIRDNGSERFQNIPIIALTANAVNGDKERCIAAGMSDYLIKPIGSKQLGETIEKWLLLKQDNRAIEHNAISTIERLDLSVLNELAELDTDSDSSLLQELFDLFEQETPTKLEEIERKFLENHFEDVKKLAHFLKSSGGNLGASLFAQSCQKLESFDDWTDSRAAKELISAIREEFDQVTFAMREYLEK